jgi:hypothetical protein
MAVARASTVLRAGGADRRRRRLDLKALLDRIGGSLRGPDVDPPATRGRAVAGEHHGRRARGITTRPSPDIPVLRFAHPGLERGARIAVPTHHRASWRRRTAAWSPW